MLKLNIYGKENGKLVIEKTYSADTYTLMFGTMEDVVRLIDVEKLQNGDINSPDFIGAVAQILVGSMDVVKPIMFEVFDGLTDEELRKTKVSEIVPIFINIFKYSMNEMGLLSKNA